MESRSKKWKVGQKSGKQVRKVESGSEKWKADQKSRKRSKSGNRVRRVENR